jgi:hypothetical protein
LAAAEFALKWFGFKTRAIVNPLVASVGTTAVKVLNNNPDRIGWLIVNLSANTIYIAYGPDVSSTKGISIALNGGTASSVVSEDGEAVTYEVWAVAAGADSAIYVVEYEKA